MKKENARNTRAICTKYDGRQTTTQKKHFTPKNETLKTQSFELFGKKTGRLEG